MIITLWQKNNGFHVDIKVNREQKIIDTLCVLLDGGVLTERIDLVNTRIYSARKEEYVDLELTYQQAEIFNGDILYIV